MKKAKGKTRKFELRQASGSASDYAAYAKARHATKGAVSQAKRNCINYLYGKLNRINDEYYICHLVRARAAGAR